MDLEASVDYYDVLQVSPSAEPDTIHRVYRLLAQRFHPDNKETGNPAKFREVADAFAVLGDVEKRARYDLVHDRQQKERWRLVETGANADHDFELEQRIRLTVLEVLYTKRRTDPHGDGLSLLDLEKFTGRAREQLEFSMWYLSNRKFVARSDSSLYVITADGVDHLEKNYDAHPQTRRLRAVNA
jgi:curved DNA-binding protein CbpA